MLTNKLIFIVFYLFTLSTSFWVTFLKLLDFGYSQSSSQFRAIIGESASRNQDWIGLEKVDNSISILLMAGHADSQGIHGAGTLGEAVSIKKLNPMQTTISDELFWNLKIRDEVVRIGRERGINIKSYDPPLRNILDENHPDTNWSKGYLHAQKGGYPLEIHFDAYGKFGLGSGLIPPLFTEINKIDESIAKTFGRYPLLFRGGLGAPKRQIRILEIGKLEGVLEKNLRDVNTRQNTINLISGRIVHAIFLGINQNSFINPTLRKDDIFLPGFYL